MTKDVKDEEMICGLTADERDTLRSGLRGLPDTMPPRAVWHRIREQAEAEGLIAKPALRRQTTWYLGGSLAAAIVLAVVSGALRHWLVMNDEDEPAAAAEES